MDKANKINIRFIPLVFCLLLGSIGLLYQSLAHAQNTTPSTGTQLAYYGHHGYYHGYQRGYYRPVYYTGYYYGYRPVYYGYPVVRNYYWTNWQYIGAGCRRSCLVDRWNGRIIRCSRRCF